MERKVIGIIGGGFVGKAVANGFGLKADVKVYDSLPELSTTTFEDTINSDYVFICLPTPMENVEGGKIDLSIIDGVLKKIDEMVNGKTIVIKSSVVPGTTEMFAKKYTNNYFIVNPEFLTARNANLDFIQAARIVVGASDLVPREIVENFIKFQRKRFISTPVVDTDATTAEFIKYMANCFFATKISFMNEFFVLAKKMDADWEMAVRGFLLDGRIGNSHYEVPGWDGAYGFGGACFPKDINAMIHKGTEIGVDARILKSAWEVNKLVRDKKDWDWATNKSAVSNRLDE